MTCHRARNGHDNAYQIADVMSFIAVPPDRPLSAHSKTPEAASGTAVADSRVAPGKLQSSPQALNRFAWNG